MRGDDTREQLIQRPRLDSSPEASPTFGWTRTMISSLHGTLRVGEA